ncbi:MAG: hypothetical protein JO270_02325, partial [Acidobacteriaceae bacterium]|nr:hypothetical protein [Acidobacteriaceae bacterium]
TFSGSRTGSLYLSSKGVNLPFDSISLAATTSNSNNEVASTSGNYLSSGTGATGSPGMLVEINGTNLSDAQNPVMAPMSGNIPTTLGGAQVYFNGVAAPVFQAQSNQIISQVPYAVGQNLTTSASVFVRTVHTDGSVTVTNASPLYIANANPGIFSSPSTPNQPRPWPAMNAFHQPGNPNAVVSIDGTITAGNTATITVAGRAYNYTVQGSDSTRSVAQGLANLINSAPDPNVTASLGGAFARVILTAIQSGAAGTGISVAGSTSSGATITVTAYTGSTCCNVTPNSAISPSNPAADGELITISTAGLGLLMDPATSAGIIPNTGQPYNGVVPNVVQNNATVSATMGGSTAEVINAGLPTGSYGVYQVQLIVPSNLGVNSNTELTIAQNAFVSNTVTVPVGNAVPNAPAPVPTTSTPTITSSLDTPSPQGGDFSGTINVGGWAVDSRNAISSVAIYVDGNFAGYAVYGGPRNDVCAVYPSSIGCPNVGFNGPLDTTQLPDGTHAISAITTDSAGNQFTSSNTFTTSNFSGRPSSFTIFADQPGPQSGPFQGEARFSGWAFNKNSPVLPSGVSVYIDGQQQPGTATYGLSRADVCSAYGNEPGCPNIGWSYLVDTGQLSNGTHTFVVKVVAANGQYAFQSNSFTVANWTTANPITVDIDSPSAQGGALSGTQVFGGWAVDTSAPIYDVLISIDGVPYGSGNYGVSRSDACAATQNPPGCPNVGWNVGVDTTLLGDGSHVLAVSAIPLSGTGLTVTRQFTVANNSAAQSTISIDLPGSPSTVLTGTAHVAGWAVNSTAAVASVEVIVDGVSKGFATYGGTRSDVCAVVGNFPGCPNVGWNFGLDTSTLTNGSHLLTVTVTTAAGARSSQNASFMVSNTLPAGPTVVTITQPASTSNPFQGFANFSGRASSTSSQIQSVSITIDGAPYGTATPVQGSFANGWTFLLNTAQLADGGHTLGATVVAADGTFNIASAPFTVANWSDPNAMIINIDNPSSSSGPLSGEYHIGGWIVDQNAAISTVSVSVDGIPFGNASYGGARSDVCAVYPNYPGCPDVGWNAGLDTALLANGTHTLAITGTTVNGQSSTTTTTFTVSN